MKIQYRIWDTDDFKKKYTPIYNNISKHEDYVWQGKDYRMARLNSISDYGKLSGVAFDDLIMIPFKILPSENSEAMSLPSISYRSLRNNQNVVSGGGLQIPTFIHVNQTLIWAVI